MKKRPNILWLLSDEHHPDVSGFAGDDLARTQNLDRLAKRSVYFRNATCASPVCTPSRMTMLCGKDVHNCSAWNNHWVIFPEHVTWPEHFANHGYRTCLVGKMHFGGKDQMNGFQRRPYGDLRHGLGHQPEPLSNYPGYDNPQSGGISEIPESLLQDVIVTRESLAFVKEHQDIEPDTPWFLCASYGRPHSPLTTPGRYYRRYEDKIPPPQYGKEQRGDLERFAQKTSYDITNEETERGRQGYYACVDFLDDCVGELLDGLEKVGALENTIIIYTADHGEMLGQFGCWGKTVYYRPSVGVPLLISGPGIPEGIETNKPISLIDLFPTMCALTGLPIPKGLDGLDFHDIVKNPNSSTPSREYAFSTYYRYGIRLARNRVSMDKKEESWRCVHDEKWKYVEIEGGNELLFDMENDPSETTNLSSLPEHKELKQKMRNWLYENFSWDEARQQLEDDWERLPNHLSSCFPGSPNQYMLRDGRIFDAEKSLYDVRWLLPPANLTGGVIPQQFG